MNNNTIWITITIFLAFFLASVTAARARFSSPRWLQWVLDVLFLLPMAVPLVGYVGHNLTLLPLFYFAAAYGFSKVDRTVLDAARMQGMGRCGTFWRVFFPAARGVLGVALLVGICRIVWLILKYYYR